MFCYVYIYYFIGFPIIDDPLYQLGGELGLFF
jgi:hypothetical protein